MDRVASVGSDWQLHHRTSKLNVCRVVMPMGENVQGENISRGEYNQGGTCPGGNVSREEYLREEYVRGAIVQGGIWPAPVPNNGRS